MVIFEMKRTVLNETKNVNDSKINILPARE